jgi:elongation factor G
MKRSESCTSLREQDDRGAGASRGRHRSDREAERFQRREIPSLPRSIRSITERFPLSKPYTVKRIRPVSNKKEVDKVSQGLARIATEDLTMKMVVDSANSQTFCTASEISIWMSSRASLRTATMSQIELERPKVAFRETIRKKSDVQGKYKKQSGGHGQYGDVRMRFEPSGDLEKPYIFEEEVVGGSVPKNYFPAVEKGLAECTKAGPLAAYPVVGVRAILYDGSYHPVDSSEMAFKAATSLAFKKGFMEAGPVLLEPIVNP